MIIARCTSADWKLKQLKQYTMTIYIPSSSLISAVLFNGSLVKQDGHGATHLPSPFHEQRHLYISNVPPRRPKLRLVEL